MTPTRIIDHNRSALLRLVAMLLAAVGLGSGRVVKMLPRHLRTAVLRDLRPAESALRRVIFALAQEIVVTLRGTRTAPAKPIPRSSKSGHVPAFPLFDRRLRIGAATKVRYAKYAPRLRMIGFDDDPVSEPAAKALSPDDLVDGTRLCNRLEALKRALEDVPKQARRLARLLARRAKAGTGHIRPMRPGRPPGHRARARREVDEILQECHRVALMARPPDT